MVRKSSDGPRAAGAAAGDQSEAGRADTRDIDRDGPLSIKSGGCAARRARGGAGTRTHLRRQLLLLRPSNASAMAVQLPGPPSFRICCRSSSSSCGGSARKRVSGRCFARRAGKSAVEDAGSRPRPSAPEGRINREEKVNGAT